MRQREFAVSVPSSSGVDIFASSEVGPCGFDVIGSQDSEELINWLRERDYRVTKDMEPLINEYKDARAGSTFLVIMPKAPRNVIR